MTAKRTALFIRLLSESEVPQNKIYDIIAINMRDYRHMLPDDFTKRELQMADMIGPTAEELDEALTNRAAALHEQLKTERQQRHAMEFRLDAAKTELVALREKACMLERAFDALGITPPAIEGGT